MVLSGFPSRRSEIRSYSFLRKTEIVWVCVNSCDPNNLTIREPMLLIFEPIPIALEAANLLIAWAIPNVVFYPVGLGRHIPWEEDS